MTCKHCGRPITLGPPTPEPYWYHPSTQSVYCWLSSDVPAERAMRATPAQERIAR